MSNIICDSTEFEPCRDDAAALVLKFVAIVSILVAGVAGIAIPLIGKHLRKDGSIFVVTKAFAAGVILATGFVHMLPGGSDALSNPCLPEFPWSKFPFSGLFAMMASLLTLFVDFVGTQYYERKQQLNQAVSISVERGQVQSETEPEIEQLLERKGPSGKVFGEEESGGMHIVGIRAHAAHHQHSHPHQKDACDGPIMDRGHAHGFGNEELESGARHVAVSQILELGIVSHSVIIGLSLGVSKSPCTIRPLVAALSFHQFFEGFALGGCISQAQFNPVSTIAMACFFALTTPLGIGAGITIVSFYNRSSHGALIAEGVLDSMSAGILIYMALVDLIAADFLSKRMSCNFRLQLVSYCMLFLGAGLMAALAIWVGFALIVYLKKREGKQIH